MFFSLNSSAKAIWELCAGKHNIVEMSQEPGLHFNCCAEELLSGAKAFIMKLRMPGLLDMRECQ
jgi:hypothetical protein